MKVFINIMNLIVALIAISVFAGGVITTGLGIYEFMHAFVFLTAAEHFNAGLMAVRVLQAVDMFIIALVFLVFSIGLYVLFLSKYRPHLENMLPEWMKIRRFIELKVVLWETILTTLVIAYLVSLAESRLEGHELTIKHLILPAAIFFIAISLFFLRRADKNGH